MKIKILLVGQLILILALLLLAFSEYQSLHTTKAQESNEYPLLAGRINSHILESQSYLTFNYDDLQREFEDYIMRNNLQVSVYVENIVNGASMGINTEDQYQPASMGKVTIAILILKKIERGELQLDTKLPILDSDRDTNSGTLYLENVTEAPVSFLLQKMLQDSDNTALHVLERNTDGEDYVTLLQKYYGYYDNTILDENTPNLVNVLTMYNIYSSLYLSTVLDANSSQYVLELLSNTTFPIHELAEIPNNVTIAQKYGMKYDSSDAYFHDCGIMYINNMRIFYCVMTKGLNPNDGAEVIGVLVNRIYTYSLQSQSTSDTYKNSSKSI